MQAAQHLSKRLKGISRVKNAKITRYEGAGDVEWLNGVLTTNATTAFVAKVLLHKLTKISKQRSNIYDVKIFF